MQLEQATICIATTVYRFKSQSSTLSIPLHRTCLRCTALGDRRWSIFILDCTTARSASFDTLDDAVRLRIALCHLAEDNMAAVEPGGDDGGDEELRAIGIRTGVGHAEVEGLLVGELKVLVRELLAVDGFAAGALLSSIRQPICN